MPAGSEARFFISGKLSRNTGWVVCSRDGSHDNLLDVEVLIRRETESVSEEPRINSSLRNRRRERVPSAKLNGMENRNTNNKINHSLTCSMDNVGHEAHKRANSAWGEGCDTAVLSDTSTDYCTSAEMQRRCFHCTS